MAMLQELAVCALATLPVVAWLLWKRSWLTAAVVSVIGLSLAPLAWLLVSAGVRPSAWTTPELIIVVIAMTILAFGLAGVIVLAARRFSPNNNTARKETHD